LDGGLASQMKKFILPVLVLLGILSIGAPINRLNAQDDNSTLPFATYEEFQTALNEAVASGNIDPFWDKIVASGQMPLVWGETCVFLYRGNASRVEWRGDFSGWDSSEETLGEKQGDTDLWMLVREFPTTARLDYKIVLYNTEWILDPLNPYQQMGGFGPNSELRMPDYEYPIDTIPRDDIAKGEIGPYITITSRDFGYKIGYQVYLPANYADLDDLPTIYVTDGHEYMDTQMGSLPIVLDNLIADGRIQPVIAVFVDPRDPDHPFVNHRERQYVTNDDFGAFLTEQLIPLIDFVYKTDARPESRLILGTSLGGLNSAYMGLTHPDTFGLLGIQSPALWVDTTVIDTYEEIDPLPLKIFMSQGSIWDDIENTHRLRDIFEAKGYPMHYIEIPEGHSWGNWRALLDDMLIYFFGTE
jgi:enterochelin esterase-like enzyme